MTGPYFSLNGDLKPIAEATVRFDDLAFAYGFGVYETLKVRHGVLFFPELHEERLWHSARILGLAHPFREGDFRRHLNALVEANGTGDANLKALLIGGPQASDARLAILQLAPLFPDRKDYKRGATAITWEGERVFPQAKSLNMLVSYLAYREAQAQGAYDALLVNRHGEITEGTRTNFFVTDGTVLVTPPGSQVLEGVTQLTVRQVIRNLGLRLEERPLPWAEAHQWQGAFLTSTSTKILPLRQIGDRPIPLSPLVDRLRLAYDGWLDAYARGRGADQP
jgi:branched-subunit amino acid aminotransferase/4-amino-4-deoxychorismate lyase